MTVTRTVNSTLATE